MNAKGRQSDFIRANSYYYAQEFRSLRKFSSRVVARASRPCGPPQPQLSLPYKSETPVPLLFGCRFRRAESIRGFKTIIASRRFLAFY